MRRLVNISTDVDVAHRYVEEQAKRTNFRHYYRWICGEEAGGLGLDEWHPNPRRGKLSTAEFIKTNVRDYMNLEDNRLKIENCARELVMRRRERMKHHPGGGRWTSYSHRTVLRCSYCPLYLETRHAVRGHIERVHRDKVTSFTDELIQQLEETHPQFPGGPLQSYQILLYYKLFYIFLVLYIIYRTRFIDCIKQFNNVQERKMAEAHYRRHTNFNARTNVATY